MMRIVNLSEQPWALAQLARWHHQEWAHLNPGQSLHYRMEKMQGFLSPAFLPSTYIALKNSPSSDGQGTILGSSAVVAQDMEIYQELSPWLASVFVHPAHRRQGIGSALVLHTMAEARSHGVEAMYLFTEAQSPFYETLGWEIFDHIEYINTRVDMMVARLLKREAAR